MIRFSILFLTIVLTPLPLWGNTDYHCLSSCRHEGQTTNSCLDQCSDGAPEREYAITHGDDIRHLEKKSEREPQTPSTPSKITSPLRTDTTASYLCRSRCFKDHYTEAYCEKLCTLKLCEEDPLCRSAVHQ